MGFFLGSVTADVETHAMAIAVPLHPAQNKGVHRDKLFPEYSRGLGAPSNLKNLPIGQERDIFETVKTKNYSTNDLCRAQLFYGWRALPATKIWIPKNPRWRNCAVFNFLHAVAFRCVTPIHSS
jgi:hypothetical protein